MGTVMIIKVKTTINTLELARIPSPPKENVVMRINKSFPSLEFDRIKGNQKEKSTLNL
ncbi:hypothetical protein [Thermococcus peptonophilus]|uniref:hypothetical protein n=1 Tax=Thermococcus peptonophilus TaxID=53952 RepID=UPI0018D3971E|nr:hypothetical protein [Thermococcus peptonophilus]